MGSKAYIAPWLKSHIPENIKGMYLEPFMGGGNSFAIREPCRHESGNDFDGRVVNFFRVLQVEADRKALFERISLSLYSEELYREAAAKCYDVSIEPIERAFYFYIILYQGFSSKVDLGKCQRGSWRVAKNMRERPLPSWYFNSVERLKPFITRIQKIAIHNKDFGAYIKRHEDQQDNLMYCDPPYLNSTGYGVAFGEKEHERLLNILNSLRNTSVAISGYPSELYSDLLTNWTVYKTEHDLKMGGGNRKLSRMECLWINDACKEMKHKETYNNGQNEFFNF